MCGCQTNDMEIMNKWVKKSFENFNGKIIILWIIYSMGKARLLHLHQGYRSQKHNIAALRVI